MEGPIELLEKYWGFHSFLPLQKEIIESLLSGHDTLAIMATGSGKSLCYQLPAVCLGGLTIVISPLISLMKDQVDDLNARGIPAATYNSSLKRGVREKTGIDLNHNNIRLLFISPEKCMQPAFLESLKKLPVTLIAIDEAHCISDWGHHFRPEYRQLSALKLHFPFVPVVALTATAIPEIRKDIIIQLGLTNPREFIGSFNRPNLFYRVIPKKNSLEVLQNFVSQHRNDSGIIYCLSKKDTEKIAATLQKNGYNALAYHAGLSGEVRKQTQDAFVHGTTPIICATIAFGMGIDKPDVRYVIHYDLPKTIESYYQETGRAGRDGQPSECLLFYSRGDIFKIRYLLERDGISEYHAEITLSKLQDMIQYCESSSCRRKYVLNYFGEDYSGYNCNSCDNCVPPGEMGVNNEHQEKTISCASQLLTHGDKDAQKRITNYPISQESEPQTSLKQIFQISQEISDLTEKLRDLRALKDELLEAALKSGTKQQGNYVLQSSIRRVRQLNLEIFKRLYPDVFMKIASVTLKDAEEIIGKDKVTDLCTYKESTRYTVIDSEQGK
ncbi:RecQ family ATP-dependent DNA helicase [Methanospirillum stamsii]|uniref:DNA 3'-5' helicase n=1 Tax=Methanospirillum stamsii TaxID=1277351 RepID=A0A2V2N6N2_9EURY|nr:ATP-dependent DNA helicase RecQ [Methanospirillum stamsii]PWR73386.1 recombinase RecQ [Methanospirillum stamsii]